MFALPNNKLFSYIIKGILSNLAARQTGNEEYPPIPKTKLGLELINKIKILLELTLFEKKSK